MYWYYKKQLTCVPMLSAGSKMLGAPMALVKFCGTNKQIHRKAHYETSARNQILGTNLENEKVMFHYNIISYWIIRTSQLGSHWKWNGISVSRHNEGACNLVLIQFGIVGVTIPRDRDSHETWRRHCLLWCPLPCQGRRYIPRSPTGVDTSLIATPELDNVTLLFIFGVPVVMLLPWGSIS